MHMKSRQRFAELYTYTKQRYFDTLAPTKRSPLPDSTVDHLNPKSASPARVQPGL
jgi:hypothetical protein